MKSEKTEVFAERSMFSRRIEIALFRTITTDTAQIQERAIAVAWAPTPPEAFAQKLEPTLSLTAETAQRLMDELWHVGLRPAAGAGSAGQLAATERHLDDMRRLVAKTMEMELK